MTTNSPESGSLSLMDAAAALDGLPDEGEQVVEEQEVEAQAEADTESEEQSEDEVDESDDEVDDEEELEEPKPQKVRFKAGDEEVEVTLDELSSSYMRQQDYTRKTQQLAEQRKAIESEAAAVAQERNQYAQALNQLGNQLQQQMGREPDWDALRQSDPIEYSLQYADWQRKTMQMQALQTEQARVAQLQAQEHQQRLAQHLERERQALDTLIPEWKDTTKAKAEKALILEQGKKLGFSDQELAQAYDHRAILALRKAALYDAMMEKAKAAKPAPTKAVAPGRVEAPTSQRQKAKQQFAKSGSISDAARLVRLLG